MKEHVRATIDTEVSFEWKATLGIFILITSEVFLSFQNSDILVSKIDSIFDLNMIIWKISPTSLEKTTFDMNADPVDFLQFLQWQIRKVIGSPIISYFIDLHKQDPDRIVEEDITVISTGCHGTRESSHANFGRTRT